MVVARLVAALVTAWTVGWLWLRHGQDRWIRAPDDPPVTRERAGETFRRTAVHDLLHAGGIRVDLALAAGATVLLPAGWLAHLSGTSLTAVLVLGLLAVVVSVCSEADAFVAASLTTVSPTAQLVFLTVSPMVDLKLASLQSGTFGPALAARLAPTTFVVAVLVAAAVGGVAL